jgi:hypothetical protein
LLTVTNREYECHPLSVGGQSPTFGGGAPALGEPGGDGNPSLVG